MRLSSLENTIVTWLAVEREPVEFGDLAADLRPGVPRGEVVEAMAALQRRSLLERGYYGSFTLQPVVLEYVTACLVEALAQEILTGDKVRLVRQPLIKARARDFVRRSQERLILQPLLKQLGNFLGTTASVERHLLALLEGWRGRPDAEHGYGPGNVVNLVRLLRGDLSGLDLSHLAIRQAYLADVDAKNASLVGADFEATVLADVFDFPGTVALSHDGALITVGTSTGQVCLWRSADRAPLWAVQGHTGGVTSVAHSTDGRILASSGRDGFVRLREAATGLPLSIMEGHGATSGGVALSANGMLVAGGGADGMVRLWGAESGKLLATLSGHAGATAGYSGDGHLLASGGMDGAVRLWDTSSGRQLSALLGHTGRVWGVSLSADGHVVVSAGDDATVRLWDPTTGRLLAILEGHVGAVWRVAISATGQLIASGGSDGTVRIWNARTAPALQRTTSPTTDGLLGTRRRRLGRGHVCRWEACRQRRRGRNFAPVGHCHRTVKGDPPWTYRRGLGRLAVRRWRVDRQWRHRRCGTTVGHQHRACPYHPRWPYWCRVGGKPVRRRQAGCEREL